MDENRFLMIALIVVSFPFLCFSLSLPLMDWLIGKLIRKLEKDKADNRKSASEVEKW